MKARTFNNYGSRVNERWASRAVGLPLNDWDGIDLLDRQRKIGMEVKFAMDYSGWTVLDWQLAYGEKLEQAYWGLGVYNLSQPISSIRTTNLDRIDSLVNRKEFWIVPWDWMQQFPIHHTSGKTEKTEWKLNLAYPKYRSLPKVKDTWMFNGVPVHISEGVDRSTFRLAA